jgi:hypothetical protein
MAAVLLGFSWLITWNTGYWGPIVAAVLGGGIGGGFTLSVLSPSSLISVVVASLWGAFRWATLFLVFQTLASYAGYVLSILTIYKLIPIVGDIWAERCPAGRCLRVCAAFWWPSSPQCRYAYPSECSLSRLN